MLSRPNIFIFMIDAVFYPLLCNSHGHETKQSFCVRRWRDVMMGRMRFDSHLRIVSLGIHTLWYHTKYQPKHSDSCLSFLQSFTNGKTFWSDSFSYFMLICVYFALETQSILRRCNGYNYVTQKDSWCYCCIKWWI